MFCILVWPGKLSELCACLSLYLSLCFWITNLNSFVLMHTNRAGIGETGTDSLLLFFFTWLYFKDYLASHYCKLFKVVRVSDSNKGLKMSLRKVYWKDV